MEVQSHMGSRHRIVGLWFHFSVVLRVLVSIDGGGWLEFLMVAG